MWSSRSVTHKALEKTVAIGRKTRIRIDGAQFSRSIGAGAEEVLDLCEEPGCFGLGCTGR
jgi:hypothetical protein